MAVGDGVRVLSCERVPGIGVHERGGGPPLCCSALQDLVDFVFVVHRHLLQTLHHHAALRRQTEASDSRRFPQRAFISSELRDAHLVARVVEELQPLVDVLGGAEEVKQLLVVDLQQRDFDGELCAVLRKLFKDLMQRARDDAGQRVLETQKHGNLFQR